MDIESSFSSEYQELKEEIKRQELILYALKEQFVKLRSKILEDVLSNPVSISEKSD